MESEIFRWRKVSDINRIHSIFELLLNERPVLDVGYSDAGAFEIAFNQNITEVLIEWARLKALIEEGRVLADKDKST